MFGIYSSSSLPSRCWWTKKWQDWKNWQILIDQPADSTDHFRDPQIFNFRVNTISLVVKTLRRKSRLYKAGAFIPDWRRFTSDAYMMKCPKSHSLWVKNKAVLDNIYQICTAQVALTRSGWCAATQLMHRRAYTVASSVYQLRYCKELLVKN